MIIYDLALGIITNLLSNKIQKNIEISNNDLKKDYKQTDFILEEKKIDKSKVRSYTDEISERLIISLEYLCTNEKVISFSLICDLLNYKKVSEIEDYFLGKQEPPLYFLEDYSNFFGLELNWLRHGEGKMFMQLNKYETFPLGYRKHILDLNFKEIYFVRSKCKNGNSGIILKLSNYKFLVLPRTYKICSTVGATGSLQIESFFDLIKSLSFDFSGKINGLLVSEEVFSDLFEGKIYAGKIVKSISQGNYWWDDFLDYTHKFPISENYENFYGKEFVKAQQIVKWQKEKNYT